MNKEKLSMTLSVVAIVSTVVLIALSVILVNRLANIEEYLISTTSSELSEDQAENEASEDVGEEVTDTEVSDATPSADVEGRLPSMLKDGSNIYDIDSLSAEQMRGLSSYTQVTDEGIRYMNDMLNFGVTVPASWGVLYETYEEDEFPWFKYTIKIQSLEDENRYIIVRIVDVEDSSNPNVASFPATEVGVFADRLYLLSSGGDFAGRPGMNNEYWMSLADEVNDVIIPSFGVGADR